MAELLRFNQGAISRVAQGRWIVPNFWRVIALTDHTITGPNADIDFSDDGTVKTSGTAEPPINQNEWYRRRPRTSPPVGAEYEIIADVVSGPGVGGSPTGTWLPLTPQQLWAMAPGPGTTVLAIRIRRASDQAEVSNTTQTLVGT